MPGKFTKKLPYNRDKLIALDPISVPSVLRLPLILSMSLQWRLWPTDTRLTTTGRPRLLCPAANLLKELADCDLLSPEETFETMWSGTTMLTARSILGLDTD